MKLILPLILCILNTTPQTVFGAVVRTSHSVGLKPKVKLSGAGITGYDILAKDRARIQRLLFNSKSPEDAPIESFDGINIQIDVQVGQGNYSLIVDSGSSNTWVGARSSHPYIPSKDSQETGKTFSVTYGTGSVSGREVTDIIRLPGISHSVKQSIGVANQSSGIENADGILGIGPPNLTLGTSTNQTIPTVTDNLVTQGVIRSNLTGVFMTPGASNGTGRLDFGQVNPTGLTSAVHYAPISNATGANVFWSVNETIKYGEGEDAVTLVENAAAVVDSGTSLILVPDAFFRKYMQLTDSAIDNTTGLLRTMDPQAENLQSMFFYIGGERFELTADAQKFPSQNNVDIGGVPDATYLVVASTGENTTMVINGLPTFERVYWALDGGHSRVGFATTEFTYSEVNGIH